MRALSTLALMQARLSKPRSIKSEGCARRSPLLRRSPLQTRLPRYSSSGSGVMNQLPSLLNMLLSKHTRLREFILLQVTICFAIGVSGATAVAQPKSLKEKLIGTWHLVSNIVERRDGTKVEQFGPNPKGILIFAADGHFATFNARTDLPKLASGNRSRATPEENKAVIEGSFAYYGTYSASDS